MSVSRPDPIEKIIETNPHVDPEQLREVQELIKGLAGGPGASYGILSPYERRPLYKPDPSRSPFQTENFKL